MPYISLYSSHAHTWHNYWTTDWFNRHPTAETADVLIVANYCLNAHPIAVWTVTHWEYMGCFASCNSISCLNARPILVSCQLNVVRFYEHKGVSCYIDWKPFNINCIFAIRLKSELGYDWWRKELHWNFKPCKIVFSKSIARMTFNSFVVMFLQAQFTNYPFSSGHSISSMDGCCV